MAKAVDFRLLKRLYVYVQPYRKLLIATCVLILMLSLVAVARPYLLAYGIDTVVMEKRQDKSLLIWICACVTILLITEGVLQYMQSLFSGRLGLYVTNSLRSNIYKHIIGLRLKYYDRHPLGMLVTRVVSDIESINDIFTEGLIIIFGDLLKLFTVLGIMFYTNWELTLYVLIPVPFLLLATNIFKNVTHRSFQEVRTEVSKLNSFVQEHITGMALVQLFNRQESEFQKFISINARHRQAHIRSIMAYSVFFPVVEILAAMSIGFMLWLGAADTLTHEITVGELVAFIMYINLLYRPIRQLADRFNTLQMGMVCCERVFTVLDTKEFIEQTDKQVPHENHMEVTFSNLHFSYNEGTPVLRDINFSVPNGTTTALVGATGSGKTSIISLLARLYEYNSGTVEINGVEIRKIDEGWLRRNMVFVLQEVNLFADTVYNNITLFNNGISKEHVINCAKKLGIHEFIESLPDGYDHFLAERGNNLSSGQKQLLSILRAYVHDPKLLVFDEATSSVDSETEHIIQQAINELTKNRTCIIIAHRLSTISHAHQVVVLEQGKIIEKGDPQELLKRDGAYARLHQLQFEWEN